MLQLQDKSRLRQAWTEFWKHPASGGQCLRGAPDIGRALNDHWSSFAASLPADSHVLDLGCGAGAAASALVAARSGFRVTGVDFATLPAAPAANIALLHDTPMESLPFADACFDAAISQFGFEYGRAHKIARQMARVLKPGARFSFIVHHAGGTVVAANRAHLDLMRSVQGPEMQALVLSGSAFAVGQKLLALARAHPGDTLLEPLLRKLPERVRGNSVARKQAWLALNDALLPGRAILESLDVCCVAADEIEGWLGPLRQLFAITFVGELRKADGGLIAWR
ncbi:MAG TPA: class I SAM-dependent methyltransferase, partial [Rhizomicrobium sp.]